jgi:protein dithiol oxidoreductase (disulfide-forming)
MRKLALFVGVVLAAFAGLAGAVELKEGQQYTVYRPAQPTETKGRIEVTEFFWYGCGHCFNLEPLLVKWAKKLPKDVVVRRVPAVFPGRDGAPGQWAPGAKLYYTLEIMGLLDKLHEDVFYAVQVDRIRLINDDQVLFDWMAKKGVDARKFADIYNSFAIQSRVRRSMQLSEAHGLDGVPALIVDGRYKPSSGAGGSYGDTLVVVDQLIDMARKDRAANK